MMKTICLLVCSVIKSDNSGDDRFLPRSSSKITKSSELRREKIRSDSSWRALSPSKLECGRIIISAANGARRRSKKREMPGLTQASCFFPIVIMVIFIISMAEREGFEPSMSCPIPLFESGQFNHSCTSPYLTNSGNYFLSVFFESLATIVPIILQTIHRARPTPPS